MEQYAVPVLTSQAVVGYIVNFGVSDHLAAVIADIQQSLKATEPSIWSAPRDSLHCTLLDILAPKVDYGADKDSLFSAQRKRYIQGLSKIAATIDPVTVRFNALQIFPEAIIISGHDTGQFASMRSQYLTDVQLLAGTKPPPKIIHVTIAKFTQRVPLEPIKVLCESTPIDVTETFAAFRLVRETDIFMQAYSTIQTFPLSKQQSDGHQGAHRERDII